MDLLQLAHTSRDTQQLRNPANGAWSEHQLQVGARMSIEGGEIQAALSMQQALAQTVGVVLKLTRQISSRLNLQASLEIKQRSQDSAALTVAGVQDKLSATLNYNAARDLHLSLQADLQRYSSQRGAPLGQGKSMSAQGVYFLRREYPDWAVKAGVRRSSMRVNGSPEAELSALNPSGAVPAASFFVPQSATSLNLSLGYGMSQALDNREAYSRAIRPYAELGWESTRSAAARSASPSLKAGVRSTVLGRDQLAFGLELRPSNNGQSTKEVKIQYEWIGDR
jgi:ribosomal protein S13